MMARVFPRRTTATPTDDLAFVGPIPRPLFPPEVDEVHVSVTFTWDMAKAERLAKNWETLGVPVRIGGPATGEPGDIFVPGRYLKPGYVITSRGCDRKCWFCEVPRREGGKVCELPIEPGNNVLDDNLLACSEDHIRRVFAMLWQQDFGRPRFTGGLEAARLRQWHAEEIVDLHPRVLYLAYDTPDDWEPLVEASHLLFAAGLPGPKHVLRAYVLVGHPRDTFEAAEQRLEAVVGLGVMPMAMLYRPPKGGEPSKEWRRFQRSWAAPAAVGAKMRAQGMT